MTKKVINFTHKQSSVICDIDSRNPRIMIFSGGKRAGKTFLAMWLFLQHVQRFRNQGFSFIIGGATISTIQRNVLNLMNEYGISTNMNKNNGFSFAGNMIYCIGGDNISSWKMARGFTAHGAYLNEGTALHESFIQEVITRCSGVDSKIFIDTNPENPNHLLKKNYIDHSGELIQGTDRPNILAYHFIMDDNETLSDEYKQSIKQSTPKGFLYERDILGSWVGVQGMVYAEYVAEKNVKNEPRKVFDRYVYGVDWGFRHRGAIVVLGVIDNDYYVIEVKARSDLLIDEWLNIAIELKNKYGDYPFYCDSAMPAYIEQFNQNGLKAENGTKDIIAGIEYVNRLFYQQRLFVTPQAKDDIESEILSYAWNEKTQRPVDKNDDIMDALRYGIYTDYILQDEDDQLSYEEQAQLLRMKGVI